MTDPDARIDDPAAGAGDEADVSELEDHEAFFDTGGEPDGDDRLVPAEPPDE